MSKKLRPSTQQETPKRWKRQLFVTCALLSFLYLFSFCIGLSHASSLNTKYPKDKLFVRMRNGFLYIKAHSVPLDEILKEISVRAKVNIHIAGTLKDTVTFKSRKNLLDQTLIKLIEGKADYMFFYHQPLILREVWIFSRGKDIESQEGLNSYRLQEDIMPGDHLLEDVKDIEPELLLSTPVEDLLQSQNVDVRIKVVEILGELKDEKALELLVSALNDRDEDVRESAVFALAQIGDSLALEPIIECLKDNSGWVRASAADALAMMRYRAALPYLIEALEHEQDRAARESLQEAIDKLTP